MAPLCALLALLALADCAAALQCSAPASCQTFPGARLFPSACYAPSSAAQLARFDHAALSLLGSLCQSSAHCIAFSADGKELFSSFLPEPRPERAAGHGDCDGTYVMEGR